MIPKILLTVSALTISLALPIQAKETPVKTDNSVINQRDQAPGAMTADQQGNSDSDVETTRRIRAEITSNEKLSVYAKNIKIITKDGKVSLKGPVRSTAEKTEAERVARAVAGPAAVSNQLTIVK